MNRASVFAAVGPASRGASNGKAEAVGGAAGARSDRRFWALSAALFLALATLNYWPVLLGRIPLPTGLVIQFPPWDTCCSNLRGKMLHAEAGDLVTQFYMWRAYLGDAVGQGALPLWNPYNLLGSPFLGNTQSSLFYPFNFPYMVLPTELVWSLGFIVRTALAGLFTLLFVRSLGASYGGSITAAVVFAFCAITTVWQARPHGDAALWLPLAFWTVHRLWARASPAGVGLLAIALSLSFLAGHPETTVHVALSVLLYAGFLACFTPDNPGRPVRRTRFPALFVLAGLLALGLAAIQILPTFEWVRLVDRHLDINWGAMPVSGMVAFLSRDLLANPNSAGVPVPEGATYVGILTLFLVPFSLLGPNKRNAVFLILLAFVSIEVAYGLQPFHWVSRNLPLISGIKNARLIGVASFALAVLAGLGLTALERRLAGGWRANVSIWWSVAWVAPVICLVGMAGIRIVGFGLSRNPELALSGPTSSVIVLTASACLFLWIWFGRPDRRLMSTVVAVALCADLLGTSFGFLPFSTRNTVFPEPVAFRYLREEAQGQYRILPLRGTVAENMPMMYQLHSATGYDTVLETTSQLLKPLWARTPEAVVALKDRRLDLLNVKYLLAYAPNASTRLLEERPERFRLALADGSVRVYENLTVLPRAFVVPLDGVEVLADDKSQLARLGEASFDPAKSVILSQTPEPPASPGGGQRNDWDSSVQYFEQGINDVKLVAWASEPGILVLSQAYYPGWRVTVNGEPRPLLRVDYGLTGVQVERGYHEVHFLYEPSSMRFGAIISAVALLVTVALFVMGRVRVRPKV